MPTSTKNNKFLIKEVISNAQGAVSHAEIQEALKNQCNRVTVYRVLDRLIEEGVIHKMIDLDGISKFAMCSTCQKEQHNHEHIHFSCTQCHVVTCLDDVHLHFELPAAYKVETMNFTISGVCEKCS